MHCFSSAYLCINWQGSTSNPIKSSRGLQQGDPISRYLLFSVQNIWATILLTLWKQGIGFLSSLEGVLVLCFLMFVLHMILSWLLKHPWDKSRTSNKFFMNYVWPWSKNKLSKISCFFSSNVQERDATSMSRALGIQITEDLGRYLGAPLIHQCVSASSYKFVLDKMRKKLSGWKAQSFHLREGLLWLRLLWKIFWGIFFSPLLSLLLYVMRLRRFGEFYLGHYGEF